jgi:hypothetical protein
MLGYEHLDGASLQTNDTHHQTRKWVEHSAHHGRQWVVCLDEIGPANTGVKPDRDDFNHDEVRKNHLWGHLMAGGAGVEWLFGYNYAHNDINLEDFRSRDEMWRQTTTAIQFFQEHLPFAEMRSADEYVQPSGPYCLAKPGSVYAVYLPQGEQARLWLPAAAYSVRWFNPRTGGELQKGTIAQIDRAAVGGFRELGSPPADSGKDWLALVRLEGAPPAMVLPPPGSVPGAIRISVPGGSRARISPLPATRQ